MNLDDLLTSARPNPHPSEATIAAHRRLLDDAMRAASVVHTAAISETDATESTEVGVARLETRRPHRLINPLTLTAAALIIYVTLLVTFTGNHASSQFTLLDGRVPAQLPAPTPTTQIVTATTTATTTTATTTTATTTTRPPLATSIVAIDGTATRVEPSEMPALLGPLGIFATGNATVEIGPVGTATVQVRHDADHLCVDYSAVVLPVGCTNALPTSLTAYVRLRFPDNPTPPVGFDVVVIAPSTARLRLLDIGGRSACDLAAHLTADLGTSVVWTCAGTRIDQPWQLEATTTAGTFVTVMPSGSAFIPTGPLPAIGTPTDQIPDADWVKTLTLGTDLSACSREVTVSRYGVVIGYTKNNPLCTDMHQDNAIYDAAGAVIGAYVHGRPALNSDPGGIPIDTVLASGPWDHCGYTDPGGPSPDNPGSQNCPDPTTP